MELGQAFTICVTGFLFLTGWLLTLSIHVGSIKDMKIKVDQIHHTLVGDYQKEGLISRVDKVERECTLRHK
jgi:hypothetical protein